MTHQDNTPQSPSPKSQNSALKLVLIIIAVPVILGFLCCAGCGFMSFVGSLETNSDTTSSSDASYTENNQEEDQADQEVLQLFDISNLNRKSLGDIRGILGEPTSTNSYELPTFSNSTWEKEDYEVYVEFKKGEEIVYGGMFDLKTIKCSKSDVELGQIEQACKLIGLEYDKDKWAKRETPAGDIYESEEYSGWDNIQIKCSTYGDYLYVSAVSEGFWDWVYEGTDY